MNIYLFNFQGRLSHINFLVAEANKLTELVREANAQTRASLQRSSFTLVAGDSAEGR